MQIHLINLDRAGNRLAQFRALNGYLSDVLRFPAIDGRQVKRGELVKRGIIDPALDYTDGAIGNLLSHIALWELAVQDDAPIVICEDDAIFNRHFAQDAPSIVAAAGPDWHVIYWGWNFDAPALFELLPGVSPFLAQFDQAQMRHGIDAFRAALMSPRCVPLLAAFGTVCYSVSPAGARRLLELIPPVSNRPVPVPVINRAYANKDLSLALIEILPRINAFASFPPLVITRNDHATSQVLPAPAAALGNGV